MSSRTVMSKTASEKQRQVSLEEIMRVMWRMLDYLLKSWFNKHIALGDVYQYLNTQVTYVTDD